MQEVKRSGCLSRSRPTVSVLDFSLDEIRDFLATALRGHDVENAYLVGSVASGTAGHWSDIDLVIIKNSDESFPDRPREFAGLFELGVPVDILVYTPAEAARLDANPTAFWQDIRKKRVRIV